MNEYNPNKEYHCPICDKLMSYQEISVNNSVFVKCLTCCQYDYYFSWIEKNPTFERYNFMSSINDSDFSFLEELPNTKSDKILNGSFEDCCRLLKLSAFK